MLDIRLVTFITLASTKSFTKSAALLNITQPAVSQHIKFLEESYEVRLIVKQGKGFNLTQEGLILLKYAEQIDVLYRRLEMNLKNKSASIKTYNIGASMTIGGYVLPYLLGEHKKLYENIDILLQVNNTEEILKKLVNGKIDFAMIEGLFDKNKFKYKKFKEDELVLAVSKDHAFAKAKEVDIEDVINGNLILREKGSGTRDILENSLIKLGYELNDLKGYMEIGSISAIKSLVELNLGYTIISRESIRKELKIGTIKEVAIVGFHIKREFNFVYLYQEKFIEEFMDFCFKFLYDK
ncbi:LysR family transcriptional regulator [Clostridium sp. FP2]|uniref:LysR family transcriptional regulator n=1 Tax=Clostridium TaxID=1485 RepID=UPI0013E92C17|nr:MULTISPECIES: LysR family transcriptional regulator [Clostridium]MBW9155366.1 LysR family transcriptional regulator [Clostridium tagluense]MBZ9621656.1 LysR family transcriptional regulator [Clostridium sp. FP2]WLC66005.1 LysR family transcriptional regulator [Clostridium tagluense]